MVTELGEGVWWLDLGGVNAYLADDGVLTLIDAGTPRSADAIRQGVAEAGHDIGDVERVLLTHYDVDHVGALAALGLAPDATIHAGAADTGLVTGAEKPELSGHKGAIQRVAGAFVSTPDFPVEAIADGEGVGSFTASHTPGHTPGHTAFVSEALSAAFVGDLVFEGDGELSASPWLLSTDTDAARESVRELAERAPDVEILGMGHGVPFVRDGGERLAELADAL
jgi:glyoxylase-like metal-dependent hydrolase (beta-lactamase superfamily II)